MVMLKLFRERHKTPFAEMTDIVHGTTYDHTIKQSNPGSFRMRDGIKDIHFNGNMPFGTTQSGESVLFNSLHFQGETESLIPEYVR
jgi:hypothetical protein